MHVGDEDGLHRLLRNASRRKLVGQSAGHRRPAPRRRSGWPDAQINQHHATVLVPHGEATEAQPPLARTHRLRIERIRPPPVVGGGVRERLLARLKEGAFSVQECDQLDGAGRLGESEGQARHGLSGALRSIIALRPWWSGERPDPLTLDLPWPDRHGAAAATRPAYSSAGRTAAPPPE